jgi:hypothetical protein
MDIFQVFMSPNLLEAHVAAHGSPTTTPTVLPTPSLPSTQTARTVRLPKRPLPATLPSTANTAPRRPVITF